jgi:hypothetical protein
LVDPGWLLNATHGETTSMNATPLCSTAALISGTSCPLSPEKPRATNVGAEHERELDEIDRLVAVHRAALRLRALVGGRRELAFGEAVDAVVLDDVHHVDAAPHDVRELAQSDRRRIAVAGDAQVDEITVGERGAGDHRRHPPCTLLKPWPALRK